MQSTPTRTRGPRLSTITRTVEATKGIPGKTSTAPVFTPSLTSTPTPMLPLATPPPPPSSCPPPLGWSPVKIQADDTLDSLAQLYNATIEALIQANCLVTEELIPGTILYVPGIPPTESLIQCGPPPGWVFYTVQPGDTLFHIGLAFGVSVSELQFANCLGSSTLLRAGQRIFVPNMRTPTRAPTRSASSTPRSSHTPSASAFPTPVNSDTPTLTPYAVTDTYTPRPTSTSTPRPPSPTLTGTPTPTGTATLPPTGTPTPTTQTTSTETSTPTLTPTDTPTAVPTNTRTETPVPTTPGVNP